MQCPRCLEQAELVALITSEEVDGAALALIVCKKCVVDALGIPGLTITPVEALCAI